MMRFTGQASTFDSI